MIDVRSMDAVRLKADLQPMISATALGIFFVPLLFVAIRRLFKHKQPADTPIGEVKPASPSVPT